MALASRGKAPWVAFLGVIVLAGTERFMIEFWRINPAVALGLTMAQFMSIIGVVFGVLGLFVGTMKRV